MSNQHRMEVLEQMKSNIAADYDALVHSTNEIFLHHKNELSKIHQKKLADLEEWFQNEQKSAENIANGEHYQNDSDLEDKMQQISTRIGDFLAYKQKVLNEKFPEAAKFFIEHGYNSPILFSYQKDPPQFTPSVEIDTSDEPLFTQDEIERDLAIFQDTTIASIQKSMPYQRLLKGLQNGDQAVLTVKGMPPLPGTIGKVFDDMFEFKMMNNKPLSITYQAIARGQATIEPR
ncbi:hypothetical protein TRFO_31112 [Tritrichomonas foetus]|uniref:Uncharacterized protein n=1 Tax=Tritrichomonas foetus TaxID=1144522 RepID=A0A1J4JWM0_9EUKA|nr:hypothetical protein TRFO_31112 [Tritrichomonas foetus]|eukprot:OHT01926.1 hypothetical protein TRFO_31112 [Tritrichomonas foetus]